MFAFFKGNQSGDEEEKRIFTKALPWVGVLWLLHSFTTFMCILIHAIDKVFVDDLGGYITMIVFCTIFMCCWLQIFFSLLQYSKEMYPEAGDGVSVMAAARRRREEAAAAEARAAAEANIPPDGIELGSSLAA